MLQNIKTLRIKFEKTGPAVYISHLDLARLFSRALTRAKIELAYSEGFNPRPKIVFASAIPLGVCSLCEFADIKTYQAQIAKDAAAFFPQGINIREIYAPAADFKNICSTRFHIFVKPEGFGIGELKALFFCGLRIEKKNGTKINLDDYVLSMNISAQDCGYIFADAVIKTSPEAYLSPESIIKAISEKYTVGDYFIKKIETYDKNGKVFN